MKPLSLIIAFTPLIVFSLLSRVLPHGRIGVAGLVAAVTALAKSYQDRGAHHEPPMACPAGR